MLHTHTHGHSVSRAKRSRTSCNRQTGTRAPSRTCTPSRTYVHRSPCQACLLAPPSHPSICREVKPKPSLAFPTADDPPLKQRFSTGGLRPALGRGGVWIGLQLCLQFLKDFNIYICVYILCVYICIFIKSQKFGQIILIKWFFFHFHDGIKTMNEHM